MQREHHDDQFRRLQEAEESDDRGKQSYGSERRQVGWSEGVGACGDWGEHLHEREWLLRSQGLLESERVAYRRQCL